MRFVLALIASGVLVLAMCAVVAAQEPTDWVRANAIPLKTVEAANGFADMQPLKKIIGDARIVALGEATHGTREFFQLKHRMLEFLAGEMGFTIFSIEANMPESYRLNDYVLNGTGDPRQLLRGLYFWTWDTEEVLAMIEWMREFNKSGKGRVEFTGFDMQTSTVAVQNVQTFAAKYDPDFVQTIQNATPARGNAFGVAGASLPISAAAGKRVKLSGYIRTDAVTRGWAGLWLRVDGPAGTAFMDNMQTRGATGTSGWTRYEIDAPVGADAKGVSFGTLHTGDGTAWFDGLAIDIDGQAYTNTSTLDLNFESPKLMGFTPAGQGYHSELDTDHAHDGKQSLRIRHAPAAVADTAAAWTTIAAHFDTNRAAYRAKGAADRDIEWALQHARIVTQAARMASAPANRDRSMAENVKWILDQNPRAKVVLWAHNGHVSKGGFGGTSMGDILKQQYGNAMVVFGFAFSEGSFQAMPMQTAGTMPAGGALREFTVPAAPADSFDGVLAQSRLPIFALDLRSAPEWFRQPRRTRQIGCCYPVDQPYAFLGNVPVVDAYDAVLFVEKTTAARKNSR